MKISIGGLVQAILGDRARVLAAKSANVIADDNSIADFFKTKVTGQVSPGGDPSVSGETKIIKLHIQVSVSEIKQLFRNLTPEQRQRHQEWVEELEVEEAANILKTDTRKATNL